MCCHCGFCISELSHTHLYISVAFCHATQKQQQLSRVLLTTQINFPHLFFFLGQFTIKRTFLQKLKIADGLLH